MCINRCFTSFILPILVFVSLSFQAQSADLSVPAVEPVGHASHMFVFQQKLANKGNDKAQYKIALMYETGDGISQNIVKAKEWYEQAAVKNNLEAINRLSYLQIMENGFDSNIHNSWLGRVKGGASASEPESLFLMAQIYQHGLGVEKDLNKALDLMYRLGAEGNVVADQQVLAIEKEQLAIKKEQLAIKAQQDKAKALAAYKKKKEAVWNKNVIATAVVASTSPAQVLPEESVLVEEKRDLIAEEEARKKAEKRTKYEAVMRQLAEEQAEIDRLQGSIEGTDLASADDEF